MPIGFVYVLSNPAMPGMYKVGYTLSSVEERVRELSLSSSVPVPFDVEYWCLTENPEAVEQKVFDLLTGSRVNANREFFRASLDVIVSTIDLLVKPVEARFVRPTQG